MGSNASLSECERDEARRERNQERCKRNNAEWERNEAWRERDEARRDLQNANTKIASQKEKMRKMEETIARSKLENQAKDEKIKQLVKQLSEATKPNEIQVSTNFSTN